jgi:hypothetical protein
MQSRKSRFTIKNWAVAAIALVFAVEMTESIRSTTAW